MNKNLSPYSNYVFGINLKEDGGWTVKRNAPNGFLKTKKKKLGPFVLKKKSFSRNINTFNNKQKKAFIKKVKARGTRIMAYKITPSYGEYIIIRQKV
jgi:hypothetical protein